MMSSQESSLMYQSFCRGIKSQLCDHFSTPVPLTSTPQEDYEDGELERSREPLVPLRIKSRTVYSSKGPRTKAKSKSSVGQSEENDNMSTEVQAGSHGESTQKTNTAGGSETSDTGPGGSQVRPHSHAKQLARAICRDRPGGASPVDFVDQAIAIIRRDRALDAKLADSQKAGPLSTKKRQISQESTESSADSSETFFEPSDEGQNVLPVGDLCAEPASSKSRGNRSSTRVESVSETEEQNENVSDLVATHDEISDDSIDVVNRSYVSNAGAARCTAWPKKRKVEVEKVNEDQHHMKKKKVTTEVDQDSASKIVNDENAPLNRRCSLSEKRGNIDALSERSQDGSQKQCVRKLLPPAVQSMITGNLLLSPAAAVAAASGDEKARLRSLLTGVVAFVEVRSGHDNRSMGVRTQLRALGALVVDKFCKEVTHVVFNEGSPTLYRRAKDHGCHLVSVLWIDECKNSGGRVPESEHPPLNIHVYEQPNVAYKYRKMRSLQPDFEEGKCEERINKHLKRIRRRAQGKETEKEPDSAKDVNGDSDKCAEGIKVPDGVHLKRCSVILKRMSTSPQGEPSSSSLSASAVKRNKRKLLPLRRQISNSSIEEFDVQDRLKHQCPYFEPNDQTKAKKKPVVQPRRSGRTLKSPESNTPRETSQSHPDEHNRAKPGINQTRKSRRSSFVFQTKRRRVRRTVPVPRPTQKHPMRTMVCTFMHRRDIDVVAAVLKQLGGWILESTVTSRTTHVVCGDAKRTINLLRGIAHGCWILHQEWVLRSLEAERWLDEEEFELTEFPAVRQCRVAYETLDVRPNIFSMIGPVYVTEKTCPPRSDIQDLLRLCGATVVNTARQAKVIVGEAKKRCPSLVSCVKEQWVLDSIQENLAQPLRRYLLKK